MKIPKRIIVIITRRIGDVLLTTPLIRSLRETYKDSTIDVLIFEGADGCISANKDINNIIAIRQDARLREQLATVIKIFRRYDVAITVLPGDRPVFYSWIAGKKSFGLVENGYQNFWKRLVLDKYIEFDNYETHTVIMNLSILKHLGVRQIPDIQNTWKDQDEATVMQLLPFDVEKKKYAVIHVHPMFAYKLWRVDGWSSVIAWLIESTFKVVLVGGSSEEEINYANKIQESVSNIINLTGKVSLGQVAYLLSQASIYIGLDTAVTHLAAASGIPTIAIFGPTNPVKWGPMPRDFAFTGKSPYRRKGRQLLGNVFLLQGQGECVPCHEEGCDRHLKSLSKCLQEIDSKEVIAAAQTMLRAKSAQGQFEWKLRI